jgi:hypothetical protein
MFGRAPLVRMEETTDLMELRNLLISLGSFQKCEPARTWGGCHHQRNSASINHSDANPFFFVKKEKKIYLPMLLLPPRGGSASTFAGFSPTYS